MISVHQDFGGRGIGRKLAQKSEEYIKEKHTDVGLISGETTGALSARIFEKQGFEKVTHIIYAEYEDHKGAPIFMGVPTPHTACIVWAKSV